MGHALKIKRTVSLEEFRRMQQERAERLEFFNGLVVVGMAGTRRYHNMIVSNINAKSLDGLRKRGCDIYSDTREVQTPDGLTVMYPDLVIQCSGDEAPNDLVARDPVAIIEVLSPSTRTHDETRKFEFARRIPALRHFVLIEQEIMRVEHRSRPDAETNWTTRVFTSPEERLVFPEVAFDLSLEEIYRDVPV